MVSLYFRRSMRAWRWRPARDALKELRRRIDRANTRYPETPIRYAAALHKGQVRYGNIGAPARLDFTVIGPTVNRTVRLQELASDHDLDLVISGSLAESIDQPTRLLGRFTLTGFDSPLAVYTLDNVGPSVTIDAAPLGASASPGHASLAPVGRAHGVHCESVYAAICEPQPGVRNGSATTGRRARL